MQVALWGRKHLLRRGDFDTQPLTQAAFETLTAQSLIFIQSTKLWTIMGQFNDGATGQDRATTAVDALIHWLGNLPSTLLLYDLDGRRCEYNRAISELWVQYFVTVILTQAPRNIVSESTPMCSAASLVAASCVVTLYDEIFCHDDCALLLPVHGFHCLASSLPLIYAPASTTEQATSRQKKLDMLRGVVSHLAPKYGDAALVLGKIDGLRKRVDLSRRGMLHADAHADVALPMSAKEGLLFPFPGDICDEMAFVHATTNGSAMPEAMDQPDWEDLRRMPVEFSLFDMFDLDFLGMPEALGEQTEQQAVAIPL